MKQIFSIVLGCAFLLGSGCQTYRSPPPEPAEEEVKLFDYDGMPNREFLIGGGYMISYRAKEEGVLYVAEHHSKKLLSTISLQPGEEHEMHFDINDEKLATNLVAIGIDPQKAAFKLYFVPH